MSTLVKCPSGCPPMRVFDNRRITPAGRKALTRIRARLAKLAQEVLAE